jgi:anti-sigma regulatory factor (Ser/Thr protein kinase)
MPTSNPLEQPGTRTYRRVFPGRSDQIGEVRVFIREHLAGHPSTPDVTLVASELTTNAWEHTHSGTAHGTFGVRAELRPDDTIRLEVEDNGGPNTFGQLNPHKEGGRGLGIVDVLTTEWGVTGNAAGRTVWAEFKP